MTQRNFGLHDNTDLSHVTWSRRGYDVAELENLRQSVGGRFDSFVREVRDIGRDVELAEFLRETGVALEELYRNPGWTWTRLRREGGLPTLAGGPREEQLLSHERERPIAFVWPPTKRAEM